MRLLGAIRYFVCPNMSVKKVIFERVFISDPFRVAMDGFVPVLNAQHVLGHAFHNDVQIGIIIPHH